MVWVLMCAATAGDYTPTPSNQCPTFSSMKYRPAGPATSYSWKVPSPKNPCQNSCCLHVGNYTFFFSNVNNHKMATRFLNLTIFHMVILDNLFLIRFVDENTHFCLKEIWQHEMFHYCFPPVNAHQYIRFLLYQLHVTQYHIHTPNGFREIALDFLTDIACSANIHWKF